MRFEPNLHNRRSIRLPTWDYRERGAYFVTICTYGRECLFGDQPLRAMTEQTWDATLRRTNGVRADEFVVMPNHVHGIIWITKPPPVGAQHPPKSDELLETKDGSNTERRTDCVGAAPLRHAVRLAPGVSPNSLGAIVRTFKSAAARRINLTRNTPGAPVWQRNYYERIVRDEQELERVRQYIIDNPAKWAEDKHNPANSTRSV